MANRTRSSRARSYFKDARTMDGIRRPTRVGLDAGSRSSYEGRAVDALAQEADEGRGHLRKGPGSW